MTDANQNPNDNLKDAEDQVAAGPGQVGEPGSDTNPNPQSDESDTGAQSDAGGDNTAGNTAGNGGENTGENQ